MTIIFNLLQRKSKEYLADILLLTMYNVDNMDLLSISLTQSTSQNFTYC